MQGRCFATELHPSPATWLLGAQEWVLQEEEERSFIPEEGWPPFRTRACQGQDSEEEGALALQLLGLDAGPPTSTPLYKADKAPQETL